MIKWTDTWIEAASSRDCREFSPLLGRLYRRPRYHGRSKNCFKLACGRQFKGGFYEYKGSSQDGT